MFLFSHASGLSQPSDLVRGKERGRRPGMEERVPWSLGSSAGEALLLQEPGLGLGRGGMRGDPYRGPASGTYQLGFSLGEGADEGGMGKG